MNKTDYKNVYDRIALSESRINEMEQKLLSLYDKTEISADEHVEEISVTSSFRPEKASSPKRSWIKYTVGGVSAAAAVALCVVGGRYLIDSRPPVDPNSNISTESTSVPDISIPVIDEVEKFTAEDLPEYPNKGIYDSESGI